MFCCTAQDHPNDFICRFLPTGPLARCEQPPPPIQGMGVGNQDEAADVQNLFRMYQAILTSYTQPPPAPLGEPPITLLISLADLMVIQGFYAEALAIAKKAQPRTRDYTLQSRVFHIQADAYRGLKQPESAQTAIKLAQQSLDMVQLGDKLPK